MRRVLAVMATVGAMLWFAPEAALAQAADGHLIGIVLDPTGASIPGCAVVVENVNTGVRWNQETDQLGAYRFNNLPVGQYTLSTELEGFAATILSGIAIALNRSTTVNITLELGQVQMEVEVTAATAQIDTTSSMVGDSFDSRQALYSPSSDLTLGVLNLSLQGAGVASSGGTGLGQGPSIGGQRPRNNNFMVEGVDNNDKGVTGRIVDGPNEAVAEFSLLQNQYGAEFGRSTGGIRPDQRPDELDEEAARSLTSTYIPDQHLPYSLQWNFEVERVVAEDYTLSARYLGTRGVRLFTQTILPLAARANPQRSLPTFYQRPTQSELDALALTLGDIDAQPVSLPEFATLVAQERVGELGAFRHVHGGVAAIRHGAEWTGFQTQSGWRHGPGCCQPERCRPHRKRCDGADQQRRAGRISG